MTVKDLFGLANDDLIDYRDLEVDPTSAGADEFRSALGEPPWKVKEVKKFLNGIPCVPIDSTLYPLSVVLEEDLDGDSIITFLEIARELTKETYGENLFLLQAIEKVACAAKEDSTDIIDDIGSLDPNAQKRKIANLMNQVSDLQEQVEEMAIQNDELQNSFRDTQKLENKCKEVEAELKEIQNTRGQQQKDYELMQNDLASSRDALIRLKQQKASLEEENESKDMQIEMLQQGGGGASGSGSGGGKRMMLSRGTMCRISHGLTLVNGLQGCSNLLLFQLCFTTWSAYCSIEGKKGKAGALTETKIRQQVEKELRAEFQIERDELLATNAVRLAAAGGGGSADRDKYEKELREKERDWERREWQLKRDIEHEKEKAQNKETARLESKMEAEKKDWEHNKIKEAAVKEVEEYKNKIKELEKERDELKKNGSHAKREPEISWNILTVKSVEASKHRSFVNSLQLETKLMQKNKSFYQRCTWIFTIFSMILAIPTLHFITESILDSYFPPIIME